MLFFFGFLLAQCGSVSLSSLEPSSHEKLRNSKILEDINVFSPMAKNICDINHQVCFREKKAAAAAECHTPPKWSRQFQHV